MRKMLVLALSAVALSGASPAAQPAADPPVRLVLLIAVDQFRHDYLVRFRPHYTSGLRRLLTQGAVFADANLEHYPTVTAVGHATMLSGATPSVSGIIGNDWYDRAEGRSVASVFDRTVKPVGASTGPQASPRRLLVSTVGDELKLASAFERGAPDAPRVIGVSLKDRSAIMTVGRGADAAYWWDLASGNFVTSTYYAAELPAWVQAFNGRRPVDRYSGQSWQSLDEGAATLGQMPAETGPKLHTAVNGSPFGNDLLADFAEEALVHERLGQRGATDLLSVSFSSNDSVGHTHGPDSPHVRDISIRTDRVIGRLLARVDKLVGLQHTIVALTADHGVAPLPEEVQARLQLGGRMTSHDLVAPIEAALQAKYGEGKWVLATAGSSPYLNHELIAKLKLDGAEVRRVAAEAVAAVPRVTRVYTREQLLRGDTQADRIGQRLLRSYNAERSGDLEIILEPYWLRQATGTTHGTAYNYDAHIPMILMGRRIKAGEYHAPVALNDLAPTIATLVGVEIPSASSGRILAEALLPPRPAPARSSR